MSSKIFQPGRLHLVEELGVSLGVWLGAGLGAEVLGPVSVVVGLGVEGC